MRLFVASFPDKDCMESLAAAQEELKAHGGTGRFPAKDCFHLTFAFLGPLPSSALPAILEAMKAAAGLAADKPPTRVEIARVRSLPRLPDGQKTLSSPYHLYKASRKEGIQ